MSTEAYAIITSILRIVFTLVYYTGLFMFVIGTAKKKKSLLMIGFGLIVANCVESSIMIIVNASRNGYLNFPTIAINIVSELIIPLVVWFVLLLIVQKSANVKLANYEVQPIMPSPIETNTNDNVDRLNEYKNLLDMGAITQDEFDAKKKELLGL